MTHKHNRRCVLAMGNTTYWISWGEKKFWRSFAQEYFHRSKNKAAILQVAVIFQFKFTEGELAQFITVIEVSLKKTIKMSTLCTFLPRKILLASHNKESLYLKWLLKFKCVEELKEINI